MLVYGFGSTARWQQAVDRAYNRQFKETRYAQASKDLQERAGALDNSMDLHEWEM